jgi:hypothetical protein
MANVHVSASPHTYPGEVLHEEHEGNLARLPTRVMVFFNIVMGSSRAA